MDIIASFLINLYKAIITQHPILTILFTILFVLVFFIYYQMLFYFKKDVGRIQYYTIKEQMKRTEERLGEIEDDLLTFYLSLKHKSTNEKINNGRESRRFYFFNYYLKDKTLNLIRTFFRENHLCLMDEKEFEIHIDERAELIIRKITAYYHEWNISEDSPDAAEFYTSFMQTELDRYKTRLKTIFREGRAISKQFQNKKFLKGFFKNNKYGGMLW